MTKEATEEQLLTVENELTQKKRRRVILCLTLLAVAACLGLAELSRRRRAYDYRIFVRKTIYNQIGKLLSLNESIKLAAHNPFLSQGNKELAVCLYGLAPCQATSPLKQIPFIMQKSDEESTTLLIGTEDQPSIFSKEGVPQPREAIADHPQGWTVRAWFWAECENSATECKKAKTIHVRHQILPLTEKNKIDAEPPTSDLLANHEAFSYALEVPQR